MNQTPRDPENIPAAWYPTEQPGILRYWDGTQWTQQVHQAAPPAADHSPAAQAQSRRRKFVITSLIASASVAVLALVLVFGAASGWFRTGLGTSHKNCPSEKTLNKVWEGFILDAGLSGEKFTYKQVIVNGLPLEELKNTCTYAMSSPEGDSVLLVAFDDIQRDQINAAYLRKKWKNTDKDPKPDTDRHWISETCEKYLFSNMSGDEFTKVVQGKPEIKGGFVEVFSKQMATLFPKASYAVIFAIPTTCKAGVTYQQR